jgi:hypothetical protein
MCVCLPMQMCASVRTEYVPTLYIHTYYVQTYLLCTDVLNMYRHTYYVLTCVPVTSNSGSSVSASAAPWYANRVLYAGVVVGSRRESTNPRWMTAAAMTGAAQDASRDGASTTTPCSPSYSGLATMILLCFMYTAVC